MRITVFPIHFFLFYLLYYSGQAVYGAYFNLYLSKIGFSNSMIGLLVSLSTLFLMVAQLFWGIASDRAKKKNTVLKILFLLSSIIALMFYGSTNNIYVLITCALFSMVFAPIVPLQDNITLEYLADKRWNFGQIRMGGTIGYAITVVVAGILLKNRYSQIFWVISLFMFLCFLLMFSIPTVKGYRSNAEKAPISVIFKDKMFIYLFAFNLLYSLGTSFFYSYYPIYFESIVGDSSYIGILLFACSIAEVPFLLVIDKMLKQFGIIKLLVMAGLVSSIRWFLLYILTNPILIILANLLHGFSFASFTYCLATYINESMPKSLKATGQTFKAMVSTFFSRVIFGFLGGVASDLFGVNRIMLVSSILIFSSSIVFGLILSKLKRTTKIKTEPSLEVK